MNVTIYFGHHKVGSTALQSFLFRNQAALMRAGILYPGIESESLSYMLAQLLGVPDEEEKGPPAMNAREPHNAMAFQMIAQATGGSTPKWHPGLPGLGQMIRALRMQAKYLKPANTVLCSEVMANFGSHHPELIERVKGIFPEAQTQLYCVLRRPDDYLVSWHAQRLRFGDKVPALSDGAALKYTGSIHFNYHMVVKPWAETFAGRPLHLRSYSDVTRAGGSVEDFFAASGIDLPGGLTNPGRANESLPRAAMEIARRGNQDLPPEDAGALRQYLLTGLGGIGHVPNSDVEMFGADLRAELAEKFAPVHAYLSQLAGRAAFFEDIDDMTRSRPVPEAEAMADLLSRIPPEALPNDAVRGFIRTLARDHAA